MRNIALVVAYDGTAYLGWQSTKMGPSIESALQFTLQQILQEPIHLQAASRTDAGVHASGQVVNFTCCKTLLDLDRLQKSLNALLPKDISIIHVVEVPVAFHPTLDSAGKEYHYYLCNASAQYPQYRHFSWHYYYPINLDLMRKAAVHLLGQHDFSSFCNAKKNARYLHKTRCLSRIDLYEIGNQRLRFEIEGNHFLYKMVRNLVGTLVYIGRGMISISDLDLILLHKDRTQAGLTAPAHGLHLHRVIYFDHML